MCTSLLKSKFAATAMIQAAAVVTLALTTVSPALAQARTLTGTWFVVTQQRNCATDAPIGPSHRALVTFHAGGTLSDTSVVPTFVAGQRSEGHGIWAHDGGLTYIARWTAMINFTTTPGTPPGSPGFQAGWQIATNHITLSGPDEFSSNGVSEFYNLAGEKYFEGCASRSATRLQ